ncbi:MAG: phycobiliprotein lyase [Microcoleus sp. PH2017_29_MFU_D_A]|uniref:phycobiliprotein lyase n=1 Tax=unclassified Microcoleus TaxID=2642155 RepID=UPI001D58BD89|nr:MULTISPECIES: phycobiliprotein lyase [unclassified Microcoleus]MCC3421813.1 phycobiliprotein lyase [Microcoleus sp. PH2017_07_MST_O_A]MCC3513297.1 phycobiliprotein lyase [Microcoleus sp. PH2017_17_BER_D_A]TAE08448.1 MAG: phycobiliprotein lyase [Oscillatoriales cyanobacterium]MCC3426756.1 phycobiliprotein lyase [Microcoleus sp. PH2017_01_SCD_O_A]MCC3449831.1 phycobiliprotein lyase [Microcoleus sp. PH2017_09_SFU_O_A]
MLLTPPMTMMDFFRKSEGVWFTQRTVHNFDTAAADESGESNVMIDVLSIDDPRVLEVCQQQNVDPALVSGGCSFMWQDNLDDAIPNQNYAAILIDVPNPNNPKMGKFLRNRGYVEGIPVIGIYHFADDGVLTIETEYETNQGQERCWFINDHFRVRVMTVQMSNGVKQMAYCSERRCISPSVLEELLEHNRLRVSEAAAVSR